jgi:uncharacterized membrane protein
MIILSVFLYEGAWPIIWRLGLGLLLILVGILLANLETVSNKSEKWD